MFSGRKLHSGVKFRTFTPRHSCLPENLLCFLRLLDFEGGGSVRIYQPIQFSMMLLREHLVMNCRTSYI